MIRENYLRVRNAGRLCVRVTCCCMALACGTGLAQTDTVPTQSAKTATTAAEIAGTAQPTETSASKRHLRQAEDAYLAGAKKLEHDDLTAAETDFQRALKLDPENSNYAIAISVARQHRLTELVQQASKARQAGDQAKADSLIAEARTMDPESPIVLEHDGPFLATKAQAQTTAGDASSLLADRTTMLAGAANGAYWKAALPVLAGAIQLAPKTAPQSFDLRGTSAEVLRQVAKAYGITAVIDDSVETKNVRFNLENATYASAMQILLQMTHAFAVPLTETSLLVAKDDTPNRQRLERQLEETIDLPGYTTTQLNDMSTLLKTVFDVKQINVQPLAGSIVVRAPEAMMGPMNQTIGDLISADGEVMVEVKLYEVDTTRMTTAGATVPNGFGVYNVQAAAATLVSQNQSLVQQAIAQGLISATATNLEIAAALLESGLVQSTLLSSTIGIFGKGIAQTGITETAGLTVNLGLNSSDTRQLDDIQQRIGDRQAATFREGTRYPIISSTYTTGLSTPASQLTNATINGVSVASLLAQYSGGSSATIPQVTYEDLGITLKATPVIQRSGRVNLTLDLKIEALSGSMSDGNPILDNRQFASVLTVADGDSALMVSDVNKSEVNAMTGIPGLSELPGFQMPLNGDLQNSSTQLVVMVTPHIIRMPRAMFAGPRVAIGPVASN